MTGMARFPAVLLVPILVATVAAALLLAGCGAGSGSGHPGAAPQPPGVTGNVRIAAASDLKFALEEIRTAFVAQHPGTDLELVFGSSGNFYQQIRNGAPFDLYLSADEAYPRQLVDAGLAGTEDVFPYAVGRLVVWAPDNSPVDPAAGMNALLDPAITKIAIANPEHAPYGKAAVAAMRSAGVYDAVQDKLVLGENIAQTADFVRTGNAQIGVIALSLALAPEMADTGRYAEVPLDSFPRLNQAGVVLGSARDPQAAHAVREFLVSPTGVEILARHGFYLPGS